MNSLLLQDTEASEVVEPPQQEIKESTTADNVISKFFKDDPDDTRIYSLDKQILYKVLGQNLKLEFLREFFQEFPVKPSFTHGRILEHGELYFRCIDCEVIKSQTQKTYYCLTCFGAKSHRGHRFLLFNNATGAETCDCGDSELLNPEFCCDDHGTCTTEVYNEVLTNYPAQFKNNFMNVMQQVLYEFLFSCELQRKENRGYNFKVFLGRVLDFIIKAFDFCINVHNVFIILIGETLTQPFKKPKTFKDFFFLNERAVFKYDPFPKEMYTWTYLECIMRYTYQFKEELQHDLRGLILKLSKCHEFKSRLVVSFHKVVHFQFKVVQNDAFRYTNLIHLTLQAYASEKNCVAVIKAAPFANLVGVLKRYAKYFDPKLDPGSDVLTKVLKIFELILEKENSGRQLIESQGIMNQFIQLAGDYQKVHSYAFYSFHSKLTLYDNILKILSNWQFEHKTLDIVNPLMKNIGIILNEQGWDKRPDLFVQEWSAIALKDLADNGVKTNIHLNLPIQRTLITYLQYTLEKIHVDSLTTQLNYIKQASGDSIMHLMGQTISTIGLMRQSLVKCDYDFEKFECIGKYFLQDPGVSIFDYDFVFAQLGCYLVESEQLDLFEFFYKHFFGHDESLIKMFTECNFDNANKHQIDFFADFLNFLIQIMHGEISFFNVFYKGANFEDHVSQKVLDQIHRKILINFLHKKYEYFNIASLKSDFRYLIRGDLFHEKILKDVADIEKRTRNFKLKKSYNSLFDGFYIYTDPIINATLLRNVRHNAKKPEIAELGNFAHNLVFLSEVQQRFFESSIVAWLEKFLGSFKTKTTQMIPSVCRIILLALKLLENLKKHPVTDLCKDKIIYPFFSNASFMEKIKKLLDVIKDPVVENAVAKLLTVFVPKTNLSISMLQNPENDESKLVGTADNSMMGNSFINQTQNDPTLNNTTNMQQILEHEDGKILCAICFKLVDLNNIDVGIPAYVLKSNMNYWEFQGNKFKMGPKNTEEEEIRKIIRLIYRYYPYAGSMRPRDLDLLGSYKPPRVKKDFYPAVNSCMHYFHKTCFFTKKKTIAGDKGEFECPSCKTLSNMFIGMEKVNGTSKLSVEEQYKKDKLFLDFLRKQGVRLGLLPDPNLKFDFYNQFMKSIFTKTKSIELVKGDAAADKKILRFTNLLRASYFQLVRNSLINDFESFIARSFLCYKFAFTNLQSFIMKNFQFHKFFEDRDEMPFTVFHLLNHKAAMGNHTAPTVNQLRDAFRTELGLDKEDLLKDRDAEHKAHLEAIKLPPVRVHKHDHKRLKPPVPVFSHKKEKNPLENEKYREILLAYEYRGINLNPLVLDGSKLVMFANSNLMDSINSGIPHHHVHGVSMIGDSSTMAIPEADLTKSMEDKEAEALQKKLEEEMAKELDKEEDKFDSLQKMLLLFENDIEEDYLMVFWEVFLKFIVTNRTKDFHTNLDLRQLPVDFLFLKTLSIIGKTLISEGIAKPRLKLPEFDKLCEWLNKDEGIRNIFIEELINLTQRIVISCIIAFDFQKCFLVVKGLDELGEVKGDRPAFLNKLLSVFRTDLTVEKMLSPEFMEMSPLYPNFFAVWKVNLEDYIENSANPFFLFVKNITPLKPLIIELPSNFNEFNSEYLPKKCDNCGEFCNYCRTVVCLLCGKIMCREKCLNPPKKYKKRKKKKVVLDDNGNPITAMDQTIEAEPTQPEMILDQSIVSGVGGARLRQSRLDNGSLSPESSMILTNSMKKGGDTSQLGSVRTIKVSRDDIRPKKGMVGNIDAHLNKVKSQDKKTMAIKPAKSAKNLPDLRSPKNMSKSPIELPRSPKNFSKSPGSLSRSPKNLDLSLNTTIPEKKGKKLAPIKDLKKKDRAQTDRGPEPKATIEPEKTKPNLDDSLEGVEEVPEGNMPEHAMKEHKGHTIYIGVQDINVILYSNPRLAIYPDKLYVDRFGQLLSEKVNIFEEDWNAFEMNPFFLKRLRDTVENHKIPQLIYAISKNYEIKM